MILMILKLIQKLHIQDEAVNSSKTITKRNNLHNFEITKGRKDI